ncbi:MAG: hypothetical protein ACREMO_09005 [Gemmatimonadales bacterium]
MARRFLASLLLAMLLGAGLAAAQSTGTPVFAAPYRAFQSSEIGGSFSDPGGPGWALEGFYRRGYKKYDIGFRAGLADSKNTDTRFLLGGDFRARVLSHSEHFPLDGAVTLGLGGNFGNGVNVGYVPIGLSLGRRVLLEGSQTNFVPYVHPVVTPTFGDTNEDVLFTLGLGVDIKFNRNLDLRVSGAIGDLDGVGISLAFLR